MDNGFVMLITYVSGIAISVFLMGIIQGNACLKRVFLKKTVDEYTVFLAVMVWPIMWIFMFAVGLFGLGSWVGNKSHRAWNAYVIHKEYAEHQKKKV